MCLKQDWNHRIVYTEILYHYSSPTAIVVNGNKTEFIAIATASIHYYIC